MHYVKPAFIASFMLFFFPGILGSLDYNGLKQFLVFFNKFFSLSPTYLHCECKCKRTINEEMDKKLGCCKLR